LTGLFKCPIATIASIARVPVMMAGSDSWNSLDANPIWILNASLIALAFPFVPLYALDEPVWLCSITTFPHFDEKSGEIEVAIASTESEPPILNVKLLLFSKQIE
jgi:hypothetical protein